MLLSAMRWLRFERGPRRIADVVDETGLSPRRFVHQFSDEVGLTPKSFCRRRHSPSSAP